MEMRLRSGLYMPVRAACIFEKPAAALLTNHLNSSGDGYQAAGPVVFALRACRVAGPVNSVSKISQVITKGMFPMNMNTSSNSKFVRLSVAAVAVLALGSAHALAGGAHKGGHSSKIGKPGKAAAVTRTIKIKAYDTAFSPSSIKVHKGETIRFIITNTGDLVHEFNIGTVKMHKAHQDEMMKMMDSGVLRADHINHKMMNMGGKMQHNDPNSVLLEPGDKKQVIWTFSNTGRLKFACNVPGHYESGMVGNIKVTGGR